jgi:hypothetical protein
MSVEALVSMIERSAADPANCDASELVALFGQFGKQLVDSGDEHEFELAVASVRLLLEHEATCSPSVIADGLLDVGFAFSTRGDTLRGLRFVEQAQRVAEEHELQPASRRAYSVLSGLYTQVGRPTYGVEYANRALVLAQRLDDPIGVVAAKVNLTAALVSLGLYRECVAVATAMTQPTYDVRELVDLSLIVGVNLAAAAISLGDHVLAMTVSRKIAHANFFVGGRQEGMTRLIAEMHLLRCNVALVDASATDESINGVRRLAPVVGGPRAEVNLQSAEAIYAEFRGDFTSALDRLRALLPKCKEIVPLYHDVLTQLTHVARSLGDRQMTVSI